MKIVCFGYREWSIGIYKRISRIKNLKVIIYKKKNSLNFKKLKKINPSYILFYGWSWKVDKKIINNFKCIMLHPSKLPNFRGGSPIQNQIINGITKSEITIFRMNNLIDGGNIIFQKKFSLKGEISDIFKRMESIGFDLTKKLLKGNYSEKIQNLKKFSIYKRIQPSKSEITLYEIKNKSSKYLYNKIRMLTDPYPNAFIKTKDGKKLFIKRALLGK